MTNPEPKLITGPLHADNKGATDWGHQGFIAYGCHRYVVVVDPKTHQSATKSAADDIETILEKISEIPFKITSKVKWAREKYHHAFATGSTYNLMLAAADSGGNILVWDIVSGNIRTEFQRQPVHIKFLDLEWFPGHDESHDLLLVLRYPAQLEMWDAYSGVQLWKKTFGDNLLSFALDPFDINRLICLSEVTKLFMVSDVNPTKEPQTDKLKQLWYSDPNPVVNSQGSMKRQNSGEKSPRRSSSSSWTRMASLATNMILPVSSSESLSKRWSISDEDQETLSSCLQVVFSPIHNHVVLLVFSTEIQFIDVDVELVVGAIRLDRNSPFIVKVLPCRTSDMLFCLHDNGSTSIRKRKQKICTEKQQDVALDMQYEMCCLSDSLRLLRQTKIVGFLYHPITEKQVTIHLSDSRIIILDVMATSFSKEDPTIASNNFTLGEMVNDLSVVLPGNRTNSNEDEIIVRMMVSGLVSGLNYPVTCISMKPSTATTHEVGQHVAVGFGCGSIQLVNVYSGQVDFEYKVFSYPVRGMEWIYFSEIITYTYTEPSSYGNRGVRNEIIALNVTTGELDVIRGNMGNEGPIQFVKTSPSGKFMAVALKDKPVELWNIKAKQIVKRLTDLPNKPNYVGWYSSIGRTATVSLFEQCFIPVSYENLCLCRVPIYDGIVQTPVFFMNEQVFGQPNKVDIVVFVSKGIYMIIADKSGQIFLKYKSISKKISERPGVSVKCIQFAPGRNNYKFLILYDQNIDFWEILEEKCAGPAREPPLVPRLSNFEANHDPKDIHRDEPTGKIVQEIQRS